MKEKHLQGHRNMAPRIEIVSFNIPGKGKYLSKNMQSFISNFTLEVMERLQGDVVEIGKANSGIWQKLQRH